MSCTPRQLLDRMQGLYALRELGLAEPLLTEQLAERCACFAAEDFLKFDPASTTPPKQLREDCACGAIVRAGAARCSECQRPAVPMSAYDAWLEALVHTFHGCRMGIGLGACFFDILSQVAAAIYDNATPLSKKDGYYRAYALTHVVYTLSNFH